LICTEFDGQGRADKKFARRRAPDLGQVTFKLLPVYLKKNPDCQMDQNLLKKSTLILFLFLFTGIGHAQSGDRYSGEVAGIRTKYDSIWDVSRPTLVFTGSSSIRMWKDLGERFPNHQDLNTGFGGSQFSDLENHLDELVLDYAQLKAFIYAADNDLSAGKGRREIIKSAERVIHRLQKSRPHIEIVLISPKPSLARWNLRGKYKRLNRKLSRLATKTQGVEFVDVWSPMLEDGRPKEDLFLEDGLHMNTKGYDIWYDELKEMVE